MLDAVLMHHKDVVSGCRPHQVSELGLEWKDRVKIEEGIWDILTQLRSWGRDARERQRIDISPPID